MKKYIYNKKNNTYRSDICINTKDYRLANLVRALNYEKIPYKIINNELYYIKDENNIIHINSAIKAAHYITEDDSSQRLLNILESYNLGNKQHQVMLLKKYSPQAKSFCHLIPELNDTNCFEVHTQEAAQQYLQKNTPNVICIEYGQPFKPVPRLLNRPHIFYVDRQQDIAEIKKFLQ